MVHLQDEACIRKISSSYTPSQVNDYLARVGWSHPTTSSSAFNALSDLMLMHSTTFPSENTDLH
jgi:arylamine N-acetyltransferase